MNCKCLRCDHQWYSRNPEKRPIACPDCHSPYWDQPRKVVKE